MSSLSSSVGLISGLPISDLVDGLLAGQKRPITLLENRLAGLTTLRTAFLDLSARLLSLKGKSEALKSRDIFRATSAASSDETVLRAVAQSGAALGAYSFLVRQLAANHQVVSNGFASSNGAFLSPGKFVVDSAAARLDRSTQLSTLRGGQGVRGGVIRVTDRAGATADIDLTAARSVSDVIEAINGQSKANVRARVDGDRIVIEDGTGLSTGSLTIADANGGAAAADLGLVGTSATGVINGADIVYLGNGLRLESLNDGTGLRRGSAGADFRLELADGSSLDVDLSGRLTTTTALSVLNGGGGVAAGSIQIKNRAGATATVDLTGAATVGEVLSRINASGIGVTASLSSKGLLLTDSTTGENTLAVTDLNGGTAARDLGLTQPANGATVTGTGILRVDTLGDVLNLINNASGNSGRVSASISADGDRLVLNDLTTGPGELHVVSLNGSQAALDLGLLRPTGGAPSITSSRLLAGLDTVLLRSLAGGIRDGGATGGVQAGVIRFTNRAGLSTEVDLTDAEGLNEVIAAINGSGSGLSAAISESGLGLVLTDSSGGTGNLIVDDVTGSGAAALGIAFNGAASTVRSVNAQRRYISEATRLDQFDLGAAVPRGKFRITNSAGQTAVVDLTQGDEITVGDLIDEVNSRGINVTARINASGDGIELVDNSGGAAQLKVTEEEGGSVARTLRLLGTAATGTNTINGSFETSLEITATDTLDTLSSRLAAANSGLNIAVINDGTPGGGYRITFTARRSGLIGRFALDGTTTGLNFTTLTRGRDAVLQVGGSDSTPLVITSSSNTIENAVPGLKLDLLGVGSQPVSINVSQDVDSIVERLSAFAESFNAVLSRIDELSTFNSDTGERGVLLGDRTADQVAARLTGLLSRSVSGATGRFTRLSGAGFSFRDGRLKFDESRFRSAYAADPQAVTDLFSREKEGLATIISDTIEDLTTSDGGVLTRRSETIIQTEDSLATRKSQLEILLERRRERLTNQFFATEQALARLQSQQTALGSLSAIASQLRGSSSAAGSGS